MYNETHNMSNTEETDTEGGTRKIESTDINKEVVFEQSNGTSKPVTERVIMPKIEGAIVIAEGGGNATIKTNIVQAVSAVTGLATYKVQVFKMKI